MKSKKIFIILSIVLLIVSVSLVSMRYYKITHLPEYKFKVEIIDPYDMFRGSYITLNLLPNEIESPYDPTYYYKVEDNRNGLYVEFSTDNEGFVQFDNMLFNKPKTDKYIRKQNYDYSYNEYTNKYNIDMEYRYYLNEEMAMDAEDAYEENINNAHVTATIDNGRISIKNVYINDMLLEEYVRLQNPIRYLK